MDRRVNVLFNQTLRQNNSVFKVVAVPRHESDKHITSKRQFTVLSRRTINEQLPLFHFVANSNNRLLIERRPFVQTREFPQRITLAVDFNDCSVDVSDFPSFLRLHKHPGMPSDDRLHSSSDDRLFGDEQRHRLPLHVRAHQSPVCIVVLQERNQTGRHTNHLSR